ncbi:MAG: NUDIX hydrolase [Alphaproteobacteria bacterium]|nr:NUDIX hydrolase [Alphaproteobacteria bacterium]
MTRLTYEDYLKHLQGLARGDEHSGEIRLLTSKEEIEQARAEIKVRLRQRGEDESLAKIGVVYQDQYLIVFRDAVRFRTGNAGTYLRVTLPGGLQGDAGVVLIVTRAGQVLLKRSYRHATRRWELEFPRGFRAIGRSIEGAALDELHEETGYRGSAEPVIIGRFLPDSGLMPHTVTVVGVEVSGHPDAMNLEEMESIQSEEVWMTPTQITASTRDGTLRDGMTLAAWALYRSRQSGAGNNDGRQW